MTDDKLDANDILRGEGPDGVRRLNDGAKKLWRAPEVIDRGPQRGGNGAGPRDGPKPRKQVRVTMGANMEPQKIVWLWDGWLARGKLHILAGRPGSLKTTAAMSFAAAVTRGGQWPDGSAAEAGNVLIWSGEDAVDDTLLPRFIAAGGDRARVAFVSGVEEGGRKRSFNPASDMEALAAVCAELGDIKLVIIDPVVAVAKGDSHKNAEARRDLQPLVDLAEKTQAAVLGIHHLTKRTEGCRPGRPDFRFASLRRRASRCSFERPGQPRPDRDARPSHAGEKQHRACIWRL
jgi:hypothetical protein